METLGKRLRRRRVEELRLTLRDLASRMEVAPMYVSQIERGKRRPRKKETLAAIAQAYGLAFEEVEELSLRSGDGVELKLSSGDAERDALAVALARSWRDLSPTQIADLRRVMEGTDDAAD